jgi:hypothetical protein
MKTIVSGVVLTFLALAGPLAAQAPRGEAPACPVAAQVVGDASQPFAAVRYLADPRLEGRRAGTPGERCAAEYVAAQFRRLGLEPLGVDGSYLQPVPVPGLTNPHEMSAVGHNVVAHLPGRDPALRSEVILIGAHVDHLGLGGMGSLAPDQTGSVHPGADDNASGVAAMLEAARRLAADPPARSVMFVAFTAEELGLIGSAHFVNQPPFGLEGIRAMLNLDMVGRLEGDPLIVHGTGTAEEWGDILERANIDGIPLAFEPGGYGPSDHTSFYARDIPVLHFFTNTHADYHRPSDQWERIDTVGVRKVAHLVERVARDAADRPAGLAVVRGVGQPPRAGGQQGLGAYLGTIPDYTPDARGMKIGGVRAGSPAEEAGLQAGDVIVRMNERATGDIYAFTDALRAFQPGERVTMEVIRGDETLRLTTVMGSRGAPSP